MRQHARYLRVGAASGVVWALLAIVLDGSTEADHSWAIPWVNPLALVSILAAGAMTGILVSIVFRRAFVSTPSPYDLALPLATLPFALTVFAALVWCVRLLFGYRFTPELPQTRELALIVTTYVFYGSLSLATPLLYLLAVATQRLAKGSLDQRGV